MRFLQRIPGWVHAALILCLVAGLIATGAYLALDQQARRRQVLALLDGFADAPAAEQERRLQSLRRIRYAVPIIGAQLRSDCPPSACAEAAAALRAFNTEESVEHLHRYRMAVRMSAERWLSAGEHQKAVHLLELAQRLGFEDDASRYLLANAYFQLKEHGKAAGLFEQKAAKGQLSEQELLDYSYFLCKSKELVRAARLLEEGLSRFPESAAIRDNLGFFYLELGDAERASKLLEEALAKEPGRANALNNLGLVREAQRRYDASLKLLQEAYLRDPALPGLAADLERVTRRIELIKSDPSAADALATPRDQYCVPG